MHPPTQRATTPDKTIVGAPQPQRAPSCIGLEVMNEIADVHRRVHLDTPAAFLIW